MKAQIPLLVVAFVLPAVVVPAMLARGNQPTGKYGAGEMTYAQFMKLTDDQKRAAFAELPPAGKASMKQAHAERWLERNRAQLSSRQIAVVREAIEFLSPGLYAAPDDPSSRVKEERLKKNLVCQLGYQGTYEAFTFFAPPKPVGSTVSRLIDAWLSWFSDCVMGTR